MSRIQSLMPELPGSRQGAGVRSVIPKATQEAAAESPPGESPVRAAARQVWTEHQRETKIAAAREALIAEGMPPDHPDANALTDRVLAILEESAGPAAR